jgi:hypothetical protein
MMGGVLPHFYIHPSASTGSRNEPLHLQHHVFEHGGTGWKRYLMSQCRLTGKV